MFSETRYALNRDLRVAYRTTREGPRDIVFVPNWFTNCEDFPELPSLRGWVEAMTQLGRLVFFDQPGAGASDHILRSATWSSLSLRSAAIRPPPVPLPAGRGRYLRRSICTGTTGKGQWTQGRPLRLLTGLEP